MATLYKFKAYYTKQGIGTIPSSAPVATVVNTDTNIKLADTQATTALSNLAGYYEYEYSGADALDLVCLFHTSDITVDQQDLVSYVVDKVYQPDQYKADVSALALEATLTAIKAKTDLMDASSINIVSPISGTEITILRGDTFECSISGLGSLASYVSLDFTVKSDKSAADSAAIIRIRLNASGLSDGLLTLNGAAALNADDGAIVITDAVAGDITITLAASCTDDLATSTYVYDVQLIEADGEVSTLTSGKARVIADVTRAVS